jgi:ribosomal protein S18 acetylase RimI-like enzyme
MSNIREATISDLEAILHLNKKLFDYETSFNTEYNLDWTFSDVGRNYFKKMIEDENEIALVAELEDKIVGYLVVSIYHHSFRKENPIAELDNMYIEEKFRGKGIGTQLVAEAKRKAKEKGARTLKVEAAAQNEKALSFYRACGFEDFDIILQMSL